ncbi:hypothetical protein BSKO_04682 [Bryopsis sp. KO-2023]|nr:hypothetical protein BSKO_04682 [Bryopsis sp. KO-2023]
MEQRNMRAIITTEVEYVLSMEDMKHLQDQLLGGAGLKVEIRNGVIAQAAFKEEKPNKGFGPSKSVGVGTGSQSIGVQTVLEGPSGSKRNRSKSLVLGRMEKRSRRCGEMEASMMEGCGEERRHLSGAKGPIDLTMASTSEKNVEVQNCADVNVEKQEGKDKRQLESETKRAPAPSADLERSKADGGTAAGENIPQEQVLENCGDGKQNAGNQQRKDEREMPESAQNKVSKGGDGCPSDDGNPNEEVSERESVDQENQEEGQVRPSSEGRASVAEDQEEDACQRVNISTQRSDCFSQNHTTQGMGATGTMPNGVICRRPVILANTEPTRIVLPKSKDAAGVQWLCCPQVAGQGYVLDGRQCPSLSIVRTDWFQPAKEGEMRSQPRDIGTDFLSIWQRELHRSWDGAVVVLVPNSRDDCDKIKPFVMRMDQDKWISISDSLRVGDVEGRMAILPLSLLYQMERRPTKKNSRIDSAIQWINMNLPMDVSAGQIMCGLFFKKPARR